jgi:hypothetical protein
MKLCVSASACIHYCTVTCFALTFHNPQVVSGHALVLNNPLQSKESAASPGITQANYRKVSKLRCKAMCEGLACIHYCDFL